MPKISQIIKDTVSKYSSNEKLVEYMYGIYTGTDNYHDIENEIDTYITKIYKTDKRKEKLNNDFQG